MPSARSSSGKLARRNRNKASGLSSILSAWRDRRQSKHTKRARRYSHPCPLSMGLADAFGATGLHGRRISPPSPIKRTSLDTSEQDGTNSVASLQLPATHPIISPYTSPRLLPTHLRTMLGSELPSNWPVNCARCVDNPPSVSTREDSVRSHPPAFRYAFDGDIKDHCQLPSTRCEPPQIHSVCTYGSPIVAQALAGPAQHPAAPLIPVVHTQPQSASTWTIRETGPKLHDFGLQDKAAFFGCNSSTLLRKTEVRAPECREIKLGPSHTDRLEQEARLQQADAASALERWKREAAEKELEARRQSELRLRAQRHERMIQEAEARPVTEMRHLDGARRQQALSSDTQRREQADRISAATAASKVETTRPRPLYQMIDLRHGYEHGDVIGRRRHETLTTGAIALPTEGNCARRKQSVPTSFEESTSGGPCTSGSEKPSSREAFSSVPSQSVEEGRGPKDPLLIDREQRCETALTARPPQISIRQGVVKFGSVSGPLLQMQPSALRSQVLSPFAVFQPTVTKGPDRFSVKRGICEHRQLQRPTDNLSRAPAKERRLSSIPIIPRIAHRAQHSALSVHATSSSSYLQPSPPWWACSTSLVPGSRQIMPTPPLHTRPCQADETCGGAPTSTSTDNSTPRHSSRFARLPTPSPVISVWPSGLPMGGSLEARDPQRPAQAVGGVRMFTSTIDESTSVRTASRISRRPRQTAGPLELNRTPSVPSLTRAPSPSDFAAAARSDLSRSRSGHSHHSSLKVPSSPMGVPTPSTGASAGTSIGPDEHHAPSGLAAHMMAMQEAEALLAQSVMPSFPSVILEDPGPSPEDFLKALLLSQSFDVGVTSTGAPQIFAGSRKLLVDERENEFKQGFEAGWPTEVLQQIKSAALFSQATLHQHSDTRETSWFPDAEGNKQKIQSQLLSHVYNSAQARDVFGNYYSAGVQGLDQTLDMPKFVEKRRIQNSLRRFLELVVESFLLDVCVAGVVEMEDAKLDMPESEWRRMVDWLLSHPSSLLPILQGVWAVIKDAEDSAEEETGATSFAHTLGRLDWLPPELIEIDAIELAEAISLSTSSKQLDFAMQRDFSASISEWNFVLSLAALPANQPDFPLRDRTAPKSGTNRKDVNALLREVALTASKLCDILLGESVSRPENTLCHEKLRRSAHWSQKQLMLGGRHHVFVAQDFLFSGLVSLEELQWLVALSGCRGDLSQSFSAEVLEVVVQEFKEDKQPVIPSIRVIELAVELMLAASFYNLTSSEKYSARNPWGALAVDIKVSEVLARFKENPFPLPMSSSLLPRTQNEEAAEIASPHPPPIKVHVLTTTQAIEHDRQRRAKGDDLSLSEEHVSDNVAAAFAGPNVAARVTEGCDRLEIDEDLRIVFVLLHAGETLQEVLRLSQGTKSKAESLAVPLRDKRLRSQDPEAWEAFWVQGLEMISRIDATCQCGTWGPIRWTALKQIACLYRALDEKNLIIRK